mgnify:FL=1
MRHSGLQKDVFSLYRILIRQTPSTAQARTSLREEFRSHSDNVGRNDFKRIEYLLRKGHKRVKLLAMDGVSGVGRTKKA